MAVVTHPTPETLAAFARGDLPPGELAFVAEHIGACSACCAGLGNLPNDTLAELARAAAAIKTPGPVARPTAAAKPTQADTIPPGLIDHPRYRVLNELGAGGMGVVYKAEHRIMDRVVALKVLAPHLTTRPGAAERFGKEVRAASKLSHPNIVTVFDADEANGSLFLAMEYVEGVSLDRLVAKKGPLPVPMACQFARQAALGLQHASEKGMVHRDIKPQNAMVTRKGHVKIMDFGLARFARNDIEEEAPKGRVPFGAGRPVADPLTNPNLLMGTPDYLSPEQAKNSTAVDARSDIYSLGCTLFFLLTGRPPFAHASSLIDKLLAHTEEAPPAVRAMRPEVPESLAAVLAKMLAKNPDDRYASGAEVASALLPFTRNMEPVEVVEAVLIAPPATVGPTATPHSSPAARPADTAPVNESVTLPERYRPRKAKRAKAAKAHPWWKTTWAKAAAAALVLLVVVGAITDRVKRGRAAPPAGDTASTGTPLVAPQQQKDAPNPSRASQNSLAGKGFQVLFVLPSYGLWLPDFAPVKKRLEEAGVKVVTAGLSGESRVHPGVDGGEQHPPVPVDVKLAGDLDLTPYSAIIFTGENTSEFTGISGNSFTTGQLIRKAQKADKVVAAICLGEKVLIMHGALVNKRVSRHERIVENIPPKLPLSGKITWVDEPVVTDGRVVTAADCRHAVPFADALLKAIRAE